jgi:hypothetical protein
LFVVSAIETLNDGILAILDKGHTAADAANAVTVLRAAGIELRPSFLPFTPWTRVDDVVSLLEFVAANDLIPNVDPVQYTIRLLLPPGSLLLGHPELAGHVGAYDPDRMTWTWAAADPRVDRLQAALLDLVQAGLARGDAATELFQGIWTAVVAAAGKGDAAVPSSAGDAARPRPRLTEPWFCCSEPTEVQLGAVRVGDRSD